MQILRAARDGHTATRIAADLGLSVQTVKNHITRIHERLGVETTIEAVWVMRCELCCET